MNGRAVAERAAQILDEVELAVVGKRDATELVLLGLLADGHVLIQDNPGLAKTLMARSFASVTGLRFARVQFTPDLMPSDVTGSAIYDQRSGELRFQPGPIFTNILLGDEINRAPPKTQAALLEAMQERQVTSEDGTRPLERPFLVLATQNPIEYEGTYPLPEAQLDRFLLRISVGYPDREAELELLARRLERGQDEVELRTIIDREELLAMQRAVEQVHADTSILEYAVDLVTATRESSQVQVGSSPRGTLALLKLARARAALEGRDFVTPDDVKRIAAAGAGAQDHAAPGAVDPASGRRGRRARLPRQLSRAVRPRPRPTMTLSLSPRLRAYTALAAIALIGALAFGRPDVAVLATPFVVLLGVAFMGVPLALDGRLELDRERALEGESARATITVRNRGAPARVRVDPPETERLRTNASPIEFWLPTGEQHAVGFELRAERWGVLTAGPASVRAHDRLGAFTLECPLAGVAGTPCLPTCRPPAPARRTVAEPARARQPGHPRTGRGHRVRRPAPPDPRRPCAQRQLARERQARRPLRQRAASGAQRGHRPVPRHVRRGRARGGWNARRRGPRGCGARLDVLDAARPGCARELRRGRELAGREAPGPGSCIGSSTRCSKVTSSPASGGRTSRTCRATCSRRGPS